MMGGADEEGFDNEDEDLKNDPVSNIDMHVSPSSTSIIFSPLAFVDRD